MKFIRCVLHAFSRVERKTELGKFDLDNATWITSLADSTLLAQGSARQVWLHPNCPGQLLKTIHPHKIQKYAKKSAWRQVIGDIRHGPYRTFRLEYWYYSRTAYRCVKAGLPNPIAQIGGLISTDRGLAMVCEMITDEAGEVGKTLTALVEDRSLDPAQVRRLNEFIEVIYSLNVSIPDLSGLNIVFDGVRDRFFIVDGFGDKSKIPLRTWFRSLNHKKLDSKFAKLAVAGYLDWDVNLKRFSFAAGVGGPIVT